MSKKKEILKQAGLYSIATQLTQAITVIASILSRRFLGPTQTGIWATLQIVVDYSKYTTFGIMAAVSREIPYAVGKGNREEAEKIKNLVFSFIVSTSLLMASAMLVFTLAARNRFRPEIAYGLFFVCILIFLQRINNLLVALLRCYKRFEIESELMVLSAMVNALLVALLSYYFRIYGFLLAMTLSFVFNISYLFCRYRFNFRWYWNPAALKPLMAFGLPLMALGAMTTFFKSLDEIIVIRALGFEAMGYYSIAAMALSYMSNFSSSVAVVLLPHFQEKFGTADNPRDLEGYLNKSSDAFAYTVPGLIGGVWILAPVAIHAFLPKFIPGIPAMKILALNMFFVSMVHPYQDFLMTIKKHLVLFPIIGISILVTAGLDIAAVKLGYGLEGVAAGTVFAGFLNFTLIYFVSTRHLIKFREAFPRFIKYIAVFLLFLLVLAVIQHFFREMDRSLFKVFLKSLLFLAAYSPALFALNREFSLLQILKNRLAFSGAK